MQGSGERSTSNFENPQGFEGAARFADSGSFPTMVDNRKICENCNLSTSELLFDKSKENRLHTLNCDHSICSNCVKYQESILPKIYALGTFVCFACATKYSISEYFDVGNNMHNQGNDHSFDTELLQPIFQDEFQQHLRSGDNSLDWFEERPSALATPKSRQVLPNTHPSLPATLKPHPGHSPPISKPTHPLSPIYHPHSSVSHHRLTPHNSFGRTPQTTANIPASTTTPTGRPTQNPSMGLLPLSASRRHNESKVTIPEVSECVSDRSSLFLLPNDNPPGVGDRNGGAAGHVGVGSGGVSPTAVLVTNLARGMAGSRGLAVSVLQEVLGPIGASRKPAIVSSPDQALAKAFSKYCTSKSSSERPQQSSRRSQRHSGARGFERVVVVSAGISGQQLATGFRDKDAPSQTELHFANHIERLPDPSRIPSQGAVRGYNRRLGHQSRGGGSTDEPESPDLDSTVIKGRSFATGMRRPISEFGSETEPEGNRNLISEESRSEDVLIGISGLSGHQRTQIGLTVFDQSSQHMIRSHLSLRRVYGKMPNPPELQRIQTLSESDAANLLSSTKINPRQELGASVTKKSSTKSGALPISTTSKNTNSLTQEKSSPLIRQKVSEPNVRYSPLLIGKNLQKETVKSNMIIPMVHELNFEVPDITKIQLSRNAKSAERKLGPNLDSRYQSATQQSNLPTSKILDSLLSSQKNLPNGTAHLTHTNLPSQTLLDSSFMPGALKHGSLSPSKPGLDSNPLLQSPKRNSATGFFQRTGEDAGFADLVKQRSYSRGSIEGLRDSHTEVSWGGFTNWHGITPNKSQLNAVAGHKLIRPVLHRKDIDSQGKIRSLSKLINSIGGG